MSATERPTTTANPTASAGRGGPVALPTDEEIRRALLEKPLATTPDVVKCEQGLDKLRKNKPGATLLDLMLEAELITRSQAKRLLSELMKADLGRSNGAAPMQIPGYRIESKLGAGAMAVVYRAIQTSLNRAVAIKVLPRRMSANAEFVDRFYKEGKAAARLNHPNIVQAIDVAQEPGGLHFFVMEFVEGDTVYDELERLGVYDEHEALRLTVQVAKALEHAHERGLIHRDVKPKNIMVTPERVAKLADMGLAREKDDLVSAKAEEGRAYGTPYYIAPEQIKGEVDIDFRADIYSLGATLYHMVTGRVPFDGTSPNEVMKKHLKEVLTPPDHINTNLSGGIGEVIEMMMAKKREDRYNSTKELLMDLEAISTGQPPPLARQRIRPDDLRQLAELEINSETTHTTSLNALRAEFSVKLTEQRKRFHLALGLSGFLALCVVGLLILLALNSA